MIGKIIAGSSFAGTVGYVIKEQSRILDAEGITPPNVREMVQDFKDRYADDTDCQRVYAAHGDYRHAIPAGASSRPTASALSFGL